MVRTNLSLVLAISFLFITASTFTAGFTGGQIPHMFTARQTTTTFGSDYLVNFETQNRKDVFDATEDIFAATALVGYSSQGVVSTTVYPHVEMKVSINSGRTGALVNINKITAFDFDSFVSSVSFSLIVIGSNFDGLTNDAMSSFVFANNGRMYDTRDGQDDILYDFSSDTMASPFNYDGATDNTRCGAFKENGSWRIEDTDCQFKGYHFYITGFSRVYTNQAGQNIPFDFQILLDSANGGGNLNEGGVQPLVSFVEDTNLDGVELRINTNNIAFANTDSFDKGIQISMIFIGLREYVSTSYPGQTLYPNDFKYNFVNKIFATGNPAFDVDGTDLSIPNVGTQNNFFASYISAQATFESSKISHIFCGFHSLQLQFTTAPGAGIAYDFEFEDLEVAVGGGTTGVFTDGTTTGLQVNQISLTCQTFTLRDSCTTEKIELTLDGIPTVQPATTKVDYVLFVSNPPPPPVTVIDSYTSPLGINQETTAAGTTVHTLAYQSIENKGYEGVIKLIGLPPMGVTGTHNIRVEAFGKIVVDEIGLDLSVEQFVFAFFNFDTTANNKVIITHTTTVTSTYTTQIGIGLREHTNVIDFNGNCVPQCQTVAGKDIGISIDTNPPKCLICHKDTQNRQFYPSLDNIGGCDCEPNRYVNVGVCTPCTNPLCQVCDNAAPATCLQCIDNSVLAVANDQTSGCNCVDGFYQASDSDYTKCLACPSGCATCTSATACLTCVTSTTRQGVANQCACNVGFFDSGNAECEKCPLECQECESDSKCTACDATKKFMAKDDACVCEDSYFLVLLTNEAICEKCDVTCLTCAGTATNCVLCVDDTRENNGGVCECKDGFTDFGGNCIDTNCQAIDENCQTCYILLSTGQPLCRTCIAGRVLNDNTNMCDCPVGQYQTNGNCFNCGTGCQTCTSSSSCTTCAFGSTRNADGSCSCPLGTFLLEFNNELYCRDCDDNCANCTGAANFCLQCQNGFAAVDNKCECPAKTYLANLGRNCLPCSANCLACSSGTVCSSCEQFTTLSDGRCVKDCPIGTFENAGNCDQCSDFCNNCSTPYNCMTCFSGYYNFAGACVPTCPIGTFPDQFTCVSCASPCATCTRDAFTCTSCVTGYILLNQKCLNNCPERTYFSGNTCLTCDSNCYNCDGIATNCVSCPSGKFLVNKRCEDQCPHVVINGVCTNNCPAGSYLNGRNCVPCSDQCGTCGSSSTNCTSCTNNLFTYKGNCLPSCPPKTLQIEKYCVDCDASCDGCVENPFTCLACKAGYYHLSGRCVSSCPDKYYTDNALQSCRPCDAFCKVCSGPGQCQLCEDFTRNPVEQCNNDCGANCLNCVENDCKLCAQGTIWTGIMCLKFCPAGSEPVNGICVCNIGFIYQNQCIPVCPIGTVAAGGRCLQCDSNCAQCSNSIFFCTACKDGLVLDAVSGRCETANECELGRYRNAFGQCRVICPPGAYFLDSTCYDEECPPGYKVDRVNQACIEDKDITGCTRPKFLQGRTCVDVCSPGFFPKPENRVCQGCASGCYSCLSAQYCISCNSGFTLLNNECIRSEECSTGSVKYRDVCLPFCPIGNYNREGFCLRECPAGTKKMGFGCYEQCPTLSTPDACVASCPVGFSQNGNNCELNSQTCSAGQFFDATRNQCASCATTCKTCSGDFNKCSSCYDRFVLDGQTCKPESACAAGQYLSNTGCRACPQKCGTCINAQQCITCGDGYINTGADCIRNTNVLQSVELQSLSVTKRDTTAYIQIRPTIIPNGLDSTLQSAFLQVVPTAQTTNPIVNVWVDGTDVWVSLRYEGAIPSGQVFFVLNSLALDEIFRSMGYQTVNGFTSAIISNNLPPTPDTVQIPIRSIKIFSSTLEKVPVLKSRVFNTIAKALKL